MMDEFEKKLLMVASDFLEAQSDALGNNSCNDFSLPYSLFSRALKTEIVNWNNDPSQIADLETDLERYKELEEIFFHDFEVVGYLAQKLKKLAES